MMHSETDARRERLLRLLALATFLIFFQAYMVAPLIPRLAEAFQVSAQTIGMIVPAYLIPYGFSTLFFGLLSDRIGRRPIMLASLLAFVALTALTATAQTAGQLAAWRLVTGLGASGVVPLALAMLAHLFPFEQRGRPLGWIFGAMAGGSAFGSTVGVLLEPFIGWRWLFLGVAALAACVLGLLWPYGQMLGERSSGPHPSVRQVFTGYRELLTQGRGPRIYGYVFWNALFHSGLYTWLGLYFSQHYGLGEIGIGLAILGYGIPGFLLGPLVGRAADRWGRHWLIPAGLLISALAGAAMALELPLLAAALAVTLLSLGYDLTQPLLAGLVTVLGGKRGGQAMGLNVFLLFLGFGLGSYLFGELLRFTFPTALLVFSGLHMLTALLAIPLFRQESAPAA